MSETKRIKYLLGLLSPEERELIESEYFEDEDAFQQMLTAEDDLIDAYVRGELPDEERQRFEMTFGNSLDGRDRVQFARAFAGAVFNPSTVNIIKTSHVRVFLRTATIAFVTVLMAMLAWQINDRRKMTNELRELRAESTELNRRTEVLQRGTNPEQPQTLEHPVPLAHQPTQPESPTHRERRTSVPQPEPQLSEVKNEREKFDSINVEAGPGVALINTQDASLGNNFESVKITQLPLDARNVPGLLSLQPATTSTGSVTGTRTDQANVTLNGVDVLEKPLNTYALTLRDTSSSDQTIRIPISLNWIRFRIPLEPGSNDEDHRVTLKTTDGRLVTSVDWTEPLTPNQSVIDTPILLTSDLPSGDYVLLLMGKELDGSFVKVAEYAFTIIRY